MRVGHAVLISRCGAGRSKEALAGDITAIDQAYRAALMSVEPNSAFASKEFKEVIDERLKLVVANEEEEFRSDA